MQQLLFSQQELTVATTTADEAIKARMQASAHCDGAFSTDESDTDEPPAQPATSSITAPAGSLRGSVHDIVRKLEAGN